MTAILHMMNMMVTKCELEKEDIEAVEGKTPSQRVGCAVKCIKHIK